MDTSDILMVYELALLNGKGSVIRSFLPDAWGQRA